MRVRLTLDGHKNDVLACVGIALETGILDNMETVNKMDTDDLPELAERRGPRGPYKPSTKPLTPGWKRKEEYGKKFPNGTRVVVKYERSDRPYVPEKGSVGSVVGITYQGRGATVQVKFDHNGETVSIPSSMLRVVRKVPLDQRS